MPKTTSLYVLLFSLYWAQGLPVGFMTHALPVILRAQGVSLTHIGGFGLLMAPWALKILWAPWVDGYGSRHWGHYRSWIIPTQLLTVLILILLSFLPIAALNEPLYLLLFFIALLSMNTVGATQDIGTDGLAVNILKGEQQHIGNMFQVVGSRLGFIFGGGAILWALDWLNWQSTFLILSLLVALNTLPILYYREPVHTTQNTAQSLPKQQPARLSWRQMRRYLAYFFQQPQLRYWFVILCTVKITDGLSGPLLKPLMVDLGLSLSQIGIYVTMLGAGAALIGAGLAGWSLKYLSRPNALLLFSLLKLLSLLGFAWIATFIKTPDNLALSWLYLVNALEDMFSAMLLVVVLTLVMQYSRKQMAATDFTFQVALMAMIGGGLYSLSGILGDWLGYSSYLLLITVLGAILLLPIYFWRRYYSHEL